MTAPDKPNNLYWRTRAGEGYRATQNVRRASPHNSYDAQERWLRAALVEHSARLGRPLRLLDVGCGFGRLAQLCAEIGGVDYYGFDFSEPMVRPLRENPPAVYAADIGGRVRVAKSLDEAFPDDTFDLVITISVMIHNDEGDARALLNAMQRRRAKDGEILLMENAPVSTTGFISGWHAGCWMHDFVTYLDPGERLILDQDMHDQHGVYRILRSKGPLLTVVDRGTIRTFKAATDYQRPRTRTAEVPNEDDVDSQLSAAATFDDSEINSVIEAQGVHVRTLSSTRAGRPVVPAGSGSMKMNAFKDEFVMNNESRRLGMPYLAEGQAQKHVTHNEALSVLDALVQLAFREDATEPPAEPQDGDAYWLAAGAGGAWSNEAGRLAIFVDGGWRFVTPQPGCLAWSLTTGQALAFDGQAWRPLSTPVERFGVNALPDGAARLTVASDDVLFTADGVETDLRVKLNATAGRSAAISLETDWSCRAELTRDGDDRLVIRTSADGAMLVDALRVEKGAGRIAICAAALSDATITAPGDAMLRGVGDGDATTLDLTGGALIVRSGQTPTAGFRVLPFFDDVHFQNTHSAGSLWFSGFAGAPLEGDVRFKTLGRMAVGDLEPTTRLHVDGPVRVGQYAIAQAPSAADAGAGALGGPVMAFSDGAVWRRMTDRAVAA